MTGLYTARIVSALGDLGYAGRVDARWVEAGMRCARGTLDGLGAEEFEREVFLAVQCAVVGGDEAAEALAQSYGL